MITDSPVRGRFAPSPTGRMHLGNLFTALLSWLSAKKAGGKWVLRIEDLDPQRSRYEYARRIEDDLHILGLDWDEGGVDNIGPFGPYCQSQRHDIYSDTLETLRKSGLLYQCRCSRADLHASSAPHASDGRFVYGGKCRPADLPHIITEEELQQPVALRVAVPRTTVEFTDRVFGSQSVNLASEWGDFVVRRADKAWAYQFAVVVDDAMMNITEVVRGVDLLSSSAPQIWLHKLLGYEPPKFAHLPLICNSDGIRLSKRDASLGMEALLARHTPAEIIGHLAHIAGIIPSPQPLTPGELLPIFSSIDTIVSPTDTIITSSHK